MVWRISFMNFVLNPSQWGRKRRIDFVIQTRPVCKTDECPGLPTSANSLCTPKRATSRKLIPSLHNLGSFRSKEEAFKYGYWYLNPSKNGSKNVWFTVLCFANQRFLSCQGWSMHRSPSSITLGTTEYPKLFSQMHVVVNIFPSTCRATAKRLPLDTPSLLKNKA